MIIFLYGPDTFRSRRKLNEIKKTFLSKAEAGEDSLFFIDGEKAELSEISSAVGTASLFSSKRMIIIENIFTRKSPGIFRGLHEYLKKNRKNGSIIVFRDGAIGPSFKSNAFLKFLKSQEITQEFSLLNNTELARWIKEEGEKNGMDIESRALSHLLGLFGPDLWALSSELKKISHFKQAKQGNLIKGQGRLKIVLADIEKMSRGRADENIFALTDAISQKRKPLALELLQNEFDAGVADGYLLHMLIRQFRILLSVRQALDAGYTQRKITSRLKLHPFVAQKAVGQVRNFSLLFLKRIFSHLARIDKMSKTGQSDLKTEIGLLIAKI